MKNTSLKKIGAIALAAVMAVTFAPVASLTAFASDPVDVEKAQSITAAADKTYTIKGANGTVKIDLKGATGVTVTVEDGSKTSLVVYDSTNAGTAFTFTDAKMIKSIKYGEGLDLGTNEAAAAGVAGTDGVPAVSAVATAKVGANVYTGNKLISKKAEKDEKDVTDGENVEALGGSVVVAKLDKGKSATISDKAVPGTKVSATASNTLSLIQVTTTWNYKWTGKKNGKDTSGSDTYTDTKFYAGSDTDFEAGLTGASQAVPALAQTTTAAKVKVDKDTTVTARDYTYDRAITLKQNSYDKFDKSIAAAAAVDGTNDGAKGLTYFTADPSKYIDTTATGVIKIDGKYVLVDDTVKIANEVKLATSSVELVQTKGWTKKDGNKDASIEDVELPKTSVSFSAPSDMSVITMITDDGSNTKTSDTKTVFAYGKKDAGVTVDYTSKTSKFNAANKLTVDQVAKDDVIAIDDVSDDARDKVITKAAGIGYYYVDGYDSDDNNYTFGATDTVTKSFEAKAAGTKTDDYTIAAEWTDDQTVFASKEISTTVKGVAAGVTIKGEVSQQVLSEDKKAGTKDWLVNDGKNVPQNVYRLRAKVGNNHLFTMDKTEAENAVASGNWVIETSESFKMLPSNTTVEGAVKVLRFRNVKTNEFLFSTDPAEQAAKLADPEWAEGNVAFCGVSAETGYPVTRLFSTIGQGHLYSTAQAEIKDAVEKNFYHKDGVVFFAVETPEKEK